MRTLNARDRKPRKSRSDKGKRRKLYRKRPVKKKRKFNGVVRVYESKRKEGDPIKLFFWDIQDMSLEGLHHFHKKTRKYMKRTVYGKNRLRVDVLPKDINNKQKLEYECEKLLWEGNWLILMWTHRTNKFHCSPRAVATVRIKETSSGKRAIVNPSYKNRSIARFKFWDKS